MVIPLDSRSLFRQAPDDLAGREQRIPFIEPGDGPRQPHREGPT
jgi:hypothetical protein